VLLPGSPVTVQLDVTEAVQLAQVTVNGFNAAFAGFVSPTTQRWVIGVSVPPAGASFVLNASAFDIAGNRGIASLTSDNDGIEAALDRNRFTGADQSGFYSSDFNWGGTAGTISRSAGAVVGANRVTASTVRVGMRNNASARINVCSGADKYIDLNADAEGVDITCAPTGTVTVTAYAGIGGTAEVYKQTVGTYYTTQTYCRTEGSIFRRYTVCYDTQIPHTYTYYYQIVVPTFQTVSTGSPVTASPDNTEPIQVTLLQIDDDGTQNAVADFLLDPGESADVHVTQGANREDLIEFSTLAGTITAQVGGATQTIGEGQRAVITLDLTSPVVTVPANITGEATSSNGAVVTFLASATDNVDGPTAVSCTPASGSTFPLGTTPVVCAAADAHGNVASATFTVTVRDTTKPTLTLPVNVTVDATSPAGAFVTYTATATDSVSGARAVTCTPPSGNIFPIGTSTVNCTAVDGAGNSVGGSFEVLVQAAAAQVSRLTVTVQSFNLAQGIENSLDTKLQNVLNALNAAKNGSVGSVCDQMSAFINETMAQSGKKLTVAQANQLIAAAQQIRAVIGCQ
jgi:hypothetical protein